MSRPRFFPLAAAGLAIAGVLASVPGWLRGPAGLRTQGTVLAIEEHHGGGFTPCQAFASITQEHWCRAATYARVQVAPDAAATMGQDSVWVNALFDLDQGRPMQAGEQVTLQCRGEAAGWWCVRFADRTAGR